MTTLPRQTQPPATPIERRHAPAPGRYGSYRPCLRWDFGFTCAFCLLHEADLAEHGVEGTGLTWIEHRLLRSVDPLRARDYANCYYACRFCNTARGTAPLEDADGRRVLDPCADAGGHHLMVHGDGLRPLDDDARYTHETYDLDDPRKRLARRSRTAAIDTARKTLSKAPRLISRLLELAETAAAKDRAAILDAAQARSATVRAARRQLERYRAIPADAPTSCRCGTLAAHSLPAFLAEQCEDEPGPIPSRSRRSPQSASSEPKT